MLANGYILIIALTILFLGMIGTISTSHRPYSLAQNFCVIVMVSGALMSAGIIVFALLSALLYLVSIP